MGTAEYVLPEEMHEFQRNGRSLFFDPVNFVWFQTDELGSGVVHGLARKAGIRGAVEEVARLAGAPIEAAEIYVDKCIRRLLNIGFLHENKYVRRPWRGGLSPRPFIMYLHLTSRCNLKCPYCYNQEHRTVLWRTPTGTWEQYIGLIDEAARLGFREIMLTGGETLLYPHTIAIARHARSRRLWVNLLTNGTLINESNAHEIVKVTHSVSLSLDSPFPEEHDAVRGKNTHAKVLRAIRLLKGAGLRRLHLNAVITPINKDSVEDFLRYASDELEADRVTVAASSISVDDPGKGRGADRLMLTAGEAGEVLEKKWLFDQVRSSGSASVSAGSLRRIQCGAGNGVISVDSNGDVYPCQTMHSPEFRCGNVFESSLAEVLDSSKLLHKIKHLTADHLEGCRDCPMRYICSGGCRMEAYSREKKLDARNRDLCPIFFQRALDRLWSAANLPADQLSRAAKAATSAVELC